VFVVFLAVGGLVGAFQFMGSWASSPVQLTNEIVVEVKPGTSLKTLASNLEKQGVISNKVLFYAWMRLGSDYSRIQAGSYLFKGNTTPVAVREKLVTGDIYRPIVLQVTIPEGFTLKMLTERLAAKGVAPRSELEKLVSDNKFLRSLGIKSASLEGFTYPATYSFEIMPSGPDFLKRTVKTFFEKLPASYEDDIAKLGLSLTQAVTFASLIELETMRDEEKPMIAEVIWSRLKRGEPLGIDAAIIYGITNYDGDLKWKDLKNAKNRYNTRIHRGLPPTPIGAASLSSLVAVLNPTKLGYYYYVLDSEDQSKHIFSKTLAEHNAHVRKLIKSSGKSAVRRSNEQKGTH
jgi:UPF0755 protein